MYESPHIMRAELLSVFEQNFKKIPNEIKKVGEVITKKV